VLVPAANPIGLAQQLSGAHIGRFAFDATVNFNRGYPDLAAAAGEALAGRAAVSADDVRAALRAAAAAMPRARRRPRRCARRCSALAVDADLVLDVHCDGEALLQPLRLEAPAREPRRRSPARSAPRYCLLDVDPAARPSTRPAPSRGGRCASAAACSLRCRSPAISTTIELRGRADVSDALADADADALLRFLRRPRRSVRRRRVAPAPAPDRRHVARGGRTRSTKVCQALAAGVIMWRGAVGDRVAAGETDGRKIPWNHWPNGAAASSRSRSANGRAALRSRPVSAGWRRPGQSTVARSPGAEPASRATARPARPLLNL
jgi:predicted deacylase